MLGRWRTRGAVLWATVLVAPWAWAITTVTTAHLPERAAAAVGASGVLAALAGAAASWRYVRVSRIVAHEARQDPLGETRAGTSGAVAGIAVWGFALAVFFAASMLVRLR